MCSFILKATLALEMALQVWTFLYEHNFALSCLRALASDMNHSHRQALADTSSSFFFVRVWF